MILPCLGKFLCGWRLGFVSISLNPLETCWDNCAARNPVPQRTGSLCGEAVIQPPASPLQYQPPAALPAEGPWSSPGGINQQGEGLFQVAASLVVACSEAAGTLELITLSRGVSRPGVPCAGLFGAQWGSSMALCLLKGSSVPAHGAAHPPSMFKDLFLL